MAAVQIYKRSFMEQSNFSMGGGIPVVVKNLLIINVLVYVFCITFQGDNILSNFVWTYFEGFDPQSFMALHYWDSPAFNLAQLFTYMFLHSLDDVSHLFFNMFSLFMFGSAVEHALGPKRFLIFYIVSGVGAAIVQEIFWTIDLQSFLAQFEDLNKLAGGVMLPGREGPCSVTEALAWRDSQLSLMTTVGASGSVFGLLLAYGMFYSNSMVYLFFILPVKAKYFVIGYALIELMYGVRTVTGSMDSNIAHFAHLGGMLFGFLLLLYWKRSNNGYR